MLLVCIGAQLILGKNHVSTVNRNWYSNSSRRIRNDSCGQAVAEAGGLVSQVLGLGTQAEFVVQGSGAEVAGPSWSGFLGFFCWGIWI